MSLFVLIPALKRGHEMLDGSDLEPLALHERASVFAWHAGAVMLVMLGLFKVLAAPLGKRLNQLAPRAALLGSLAAVALALIAFIPMHRSVAPAPVVGLPVLMIILVTLLARHGAGKIPGSILAIGFGLLVIVPNAFSGLVRLVLRAVAQPAARRRAVAPLAMETWDAAWWNGVFQFALEKLPVMPSRFTVLGRAVHRKRGCRGERVCARRRVRARRGKHGRRIAPAAWCDDALLRTSAYKQMGAGWAYAVVSTLVFGVAGYFASSLVRSNFARRRLVPDCHLCRREPSPIVRIDAGARLRSHGRGGDPVLAYLIVISLDEIFRARPPNRASCSCALRCLGNGFILTSFLWAAAVSAILAGQSTRAAIPLGIAAVCSLIGLMHSPLPDASLAWPQDVWQTLASGTNENLRFMSPFHWAAGYTLAAGVVCVDGWCGGKREANNPPASQGTTPAGQ